MKLSIGNVLLILGFFFLHACGSSEASEEKIADYDQIPAVTANAYNAVVEIPAGTNHKFEYNHDSDEFEVEKIDGKDRIVDFLPYPGNYGFIPSTLMDEQMGGDGDPLDVLIIGEAVPTGTIVEIKPIGALVLKDAGELDTKIIAVPLSEEKQIIKANDFQTFRLEYDPVRRIIVNWFMNYKGWGVMELVGWRDDDYAVKEINKWTVQN
ncbi:MAG: inorganic diphosphatase [Saprospiraceae bacterium]